MLAVLMPKVAGDPSSPAAWASFKLRDRPGSKY
jgi:hypothetical protein